MTTRSRHGMGRTWFLLLLCLGLGGWTAWVLASDEPRTGPQRSAVTVAAEVEPPPRAARGLGLPAIEDLGETVERPLFTATRRAAETQSPAAVENGAAEPAAPLALRGVIISPAGRSALLQPDSRGEPVWVAEGNSFGGWQLAAVEETRVTIRRAGTSRELLLKDEPSPVTPKQRRAREREEEADPDAAESNGVQAADEPAEQ